VRGGDAKTATLWSSDRTTGLLPSKTRAGGCGGAALSVEAAEPSSSTRSLLWLSLCGAALSAEAAEPSSSTRSLLWLSLCGAALSAEGAAEPPRSSTSLSLVAGRSVGPRILRRAEAA